MQKSLVTGFFTLSRVTQLWNQGICAAARCTNCSPEYASARDLMYFKLREDSPFITGNSRLMENGVAKQLEKDFRMKRTTKKREGDIPLTDQCVGCCLQTLDWPEQIDLRPPSPWALAIMALRMILPDTGLGDILHEVDLVGVIDWVQYLADVGGDLFRELVRLSNAIFEYGEGDGLLALRKN